jgi:chaperonin GroES
LIPFRPLQDIVVMVKPKERMTPAGLVVFTEEDEEAEVVAVGPGKWKNADERHPMNIKVGDHVLCNKYQVQEVMGYLVAREEHIRAVL